MLRHPNSKVSPKNLPNSLTPCIFNHFRRVPIWAAHLISHEFVDQPDVQEKFKVVNYDWNEEEAYERINAFGWCRDIIQQFNQFMTGMANGKHKLPGKSNILNSKPYNFEEKPSNVDQWPVCFSANRNKKPKMEDRNSILPSFLCIEPTSNYVRLLYCLIPAVNFRNTKTTLSLPFSMGTMVTTSLLTFLRIFIVSSLNHAMQTKSRCNA